MNTNPWNVRCLPKRSIIKQLQVSDSQEQTEDLITRLKLPPDVEQAVRSVDTFSAIVLMRDGTFMKKYPRLRLTKKPHSRLFKADADSLTLRWMSPAKSKRKTTISFHHVLEVNSGYNSRFWKREKKLGIEIVAKSRYLRLIAPSLTEWKTWMRGLTFIHERAHAKQKRSTMAAKDDELRKIWASFITGSQREALTFAEALKVLRDIGYHADTRYIEMLFSQQDENGGKHLDYGGFREVLVRLGHPAGLSGYYNEYKDPGQEFMSPQEGFEAFLKDCQQEPATSINNLVRIIASLNPPFVDQGNLTESGFAKILMSEWNSIVNPNNLMQVHDMSKPLTYYWISGCVDPFQSLDRRRPQTRLLMEHRLANLLREGCRFIRLLIKDGRKNQPVVANQNIQALSISEPSLSVKRALRICHDNGFVSSQFPVILYIEHWCSEEQTAKLGMIIDDVLQDCLYVPSQKEASLPSPAELMRKIIICSRIEASRTYEEYAAIQSIENGFRDELRPSSIEWIRRPPVLAMSNDEYYTHSHTALDSERVLSFIKQISLPLVHWTNIPNNLSNNSHECHMMSMHKVDLLSQKKAIELVEANQKQIGIADFDTMEHLKTNVGFVNALIHGFHIVPICSQAGGFAKTIQRGLFAENGGCGYVLRPLALNAPESSDPRYVLLGRQIAEGPVELGVRVLCGFQLTRGSCELRSANRNEPYTDVLSPYVALSICGAKTIGMTRRTKLVANNGFDPRWNSQEFLFPVHFPSMTFLNFEVVHHDSTMKQYLCGSSCRISSIRPGLRWVQLFDLQARKIPWSGLLVLVTFKALKISSPDLRTKAMGFKDRPELAQLKYQPDENLLSPSMAKSPTAMRRKSSAM